ncbi:MAG: hypothetical protein ACOC17_00825 [Halanaerobium sp.]
MVFYALLAALISYSLNVIFNLLNGRSLKFVFESGISYFLLGLLIALAVQLAIYLYRDFADNKSAGENKEEVRTEEISESKNEAEKEA